MMKNNKLENIFIFFIRGIFQLSFFGGCLNLIFMLVTEFTTLELKWGNFSIDTPNKNGYNIPVDVTINNLPDTSIKVSVKRPTIEYGETYSVTSMGKYKSNGYDTLINDTSAKVRVELNRWVAIPMKNPEIMFTGKDNYEIFAKRLKLSSFNVSFQSIQESTHIKAKGKSKWQNVLLAFDSYFKALVFLIISYKAMLIFENLKTKIRFIDYLHKEIRFIGIALILSQIVLMFYVSVYLHFFGAITLETARPLGEYYSGLQVQFNPTSSARLDLLILGFILFIVSTLFKKGEHLQKEVDLTI